MNRLFKMEINGKNIWSFLQKTSKEHSSRADQTPFDYYITKLELRTNLKLCNPKEPVGLMVSEMRC